LFEDTITILEELPEPETGRYLLHRFCQLQTMIVQLRLGMEVKTGSLDPLRNEDSECL
jgi:hypothetical protein